MSSKRKDQSRSTPREFPFGAIKLLVLIATALLLANCAEQKPKKPIVEAVPQAAATSSPTEAPQQTTAKVITPEAAKVQEAVARVFKDAVLIDTNRRPSYVSGDFNGDLSADLAVVVKPVPEKLSSLNDEYPPWILKDPFAVAETKTKLHVAEQETLLAVIHGFGVNGWTDPQATQTYLLKNSAGDDLQARPGKDFVAAQRGKSLPRIQGDLIGEVLNGTSGYLYYTRATYSWYDPKNFKGEVIPRTVHMGSGPGTKKGPTK
jgi:hypothetical protein